MFWRRDHPRRDISVWRRGERVAERHLRRNGMRVLARNLRLPHGEIDLLCLERRTNTIVIVEVKSRLYDDLNAPGIDPSASITGKKRAKLVTLAKSIKKMPQYQTRAIRVDVVTVRFAKDKQPPEIRHYPGCVSDS